MNRIHVCIAAAVLCLLLPAQGRAQVEVQILDAPSKAFSFEPVYVTFAVRNLGSSPVVIPTGGCSTEGAFLQVGRVGHELEDWRKVSDCLSEGLVWLPSGDRWLFFQHVELGPEGEFEIQAVIRSPGECGGRPAGPDRHRIEPVRPIARGSRPYDCWSGEARSQGVQVAVEIPASEVDLAVLNFLKVERLGSARGLVFNLRDLYYRFPSSHYTYAALQAAGGGCSMLNAVIFQPDNPLNPWVAAGLARCLAYHNRPCAPTELPSPDTPEELDERRARVIAAYPPPEPVQAYLRQLEAELAAEKCPDPALEGDSAFEQDGSEATTSSIGRTEGQDD